MFVLSPEIIVNELLERLWCNVFSKKGRVESV